MFVPNGRRLPAALEKRPAWGAGPESPLSLRGKEKFFQFKKKCIQFNVIFRNVLLEDLPPFPEQRSYRFHESTEFCCLETEIDRALRNRFASGPARSWAAGNHSVFVRISITVHRGNSESGSHVVSL
jgi:hypothetical protein